MQVINNEENSSLLELRGTVKLSYEEFQKIPYDGLGHHLISGVHIITPAPSIQHQKIVGRLYRLLSDYVEKKLLGEVLISPIDVKFSSKDGFQPDIIYINKYNLHIIKKNFINGSPDIIVEVISPGSINIDRGWKKDTSEQYHVKEYWLINPQDKELEIYAHDGRKYNKIGCFAKDQLIRSQMPEFSDLNISMENIFNP